MEIAIKVFAGLIFLALTMAFAYGIARIQANAVCPKCEERGTLVTPALLGPDSGGTSVMDSTTYCTAPGCGYSTAKDILEPTV
jgi:hypothetical protein